ncbi:MAG: hypothetical protein K2G74_04095 [Muribaculaceae bacterium]|nr:hypothetical protein [Muribaculaceae bacterium]
MINQNSKETAVFAAAVNAYRRMSGLRANRERMKNYAYGRQWNDRVVDPLTGETMTEGDMARQATGRDPLTNNLIRQMVKTIIGRFRYMRSQEDVTDSNMARLYSFNSLDELDSRAMEEFLMSGCIIQRVAAERRRDGIVRNYVDNVSPADFFINTVNDPRGWDTELIGMLHDLSLPDVESRFGNNDPKKIALIRHAYSADSGDSRFFRSPTGRCRVIEVWTLESSRIVRILDPETAKYSEVTMTKEAADKLRADEQNRRDAGLPSLRVSHTRVNRWHGRFFAPDGTMISHVVSQLSSGDHPFVVKFYPLIDGEVHSFVEDIVDQQRQINRLLAVSDHILSTAAKGVLMYPTRSKPDFITWKDIARRWAVCGSLIPYEPVAGGDTPKQITSSGLDAGVTTLLDTQMKLIRDISGVGSVISGGNGVNSTGADSLATQIDNATIALNDLFATFADFIARRDKKATELPREI